MMTNADCSNILKSVKIYPWHSASKNLQPPSFSMQREASYFLSHVSFSGAKTKMVPNIEKNVRCWEEECITELCIAEKRFALYMLYLGKTHVLVLHNVLLLVCVCMLKDTWQMGVCMWICTLLLLITAKSFNLNTIKSFH